MAARRSGWLVVALGAAGWRADAQAAAQASAPSAVSITVYRDSYRSSGSIDLDRLAGFALITETRAVHLQAGENWLHFEGVADGIEPESAIVTGLGDAVLEKNRDAAVLSPQALVAAAAGKPVELRRTNPKSGWVERIPGTLLSDAEGGVVFKSEAGIEALRCSGLPETLSFEGVEGLRAHPTLSVRVQAHRDLVATVTLSYLAHGLDWAADYTATLAADGRSMDLGAWVTLANGNGMSFHDAHAQVVAGRLNRASGTVEPIDVGGPILARCWPRGSTSDSVPPVLLQRALLREANSAIAQTDAVYQMMPMAAPMAAKTVQEEALGDLKLYRVPERTTVAARQSKQVRLLDRAAIPVAIVYGVDLGAYASANGRDGAQPASRYLRTRNTQANHLGIALPSGHVQVFAVHQGRRLLESESNLRDLAVDEDVEIDLGQSPDVQVAANRTGSSHRVEISNARASAIEFELKLRLSDGVRIVGANRKVATKDGRPIFRLTVPPQTTALVQYQTVGAP